MYCGVKPCSKPNYEVKFYISFSISEYPVMVSLDGKEVPSIHYTMHDEQEPSGLKEDIDVFEPTLMEDKDTAGICKCNVQNRV